MVTGMLEALLGGFVAVFLLMVFLFRSPLLALVSMMPLTFAIVLTYGILGFVGKSYDMPIAVLSSLALGLSIDYAIHFCQQFKTKNAEIRNFEETNAVIFGEPATAIAHHAIVIVIGFFPLAFATLTPYMTVGLLFATLMSISGLTTLVLLPALMRLLGGWLFRKQLAAQTPATTGVILFMAGLFAVQEAEAETILTAKDIATKSQGVYFYPGDDLKVKIHMRLVNKKGKERIREMVMLRKDIREGGDQRFFIHFSKPNDVRNMTF